MKKPFLIMLLVVSTGSFATSALASSVKNEKATAVAYTSDESKDVKKLNNEELNCLVDRLNEIRDMDRSKLSRTDKRALRKEVKDIKHILAEQDYVVYISLTALLIILLLIILL